MNCLHELCVTLNGSVTAGHIDIQARSVALTFTWHFHRVMSCNTPPPLRYLQMLWSKYFETFERKVKCSLLSGQCIHIHWGIRSAVHSAVLCLLKPCAPLCVQVGLLSFSDPDVSSSAPPSCPGINLVTLSDSLWPQAWHDNCTHTLVTRVLEITCHSFTTFMCVCVCVRGASLYRKCRIPKGSAFSGYPSAAISLRCPGDKQTIYDHMLPHAPTHSQRNWKTKRETQTDRQDQCLCVFFILLYRSGLCR